MVQWSERWMSSPTVWVRNPSGTWNLFKLCIMSLLRIFLFIRQGKNILTDHNHIYQKKLAICIIMKTCPCNIQIFFSEANINYFIEKHGYFQYFSSKHTLYVHVRTKVVLTSNHNVCFGPKIRKLGIPLQTSLSI